MERIEQALEEAGQGAREGAYIGMGEVSFGLFVADYEVAEAMVRTAVAGTKFAAVHQIRQIGYSVFV